jgi:hypothetical protein
MGEVIIRRHDRHRVLAARSGQTLPSVSFWQRTFSVGY